MKKQEFEKGQIGWAWDVDVKYAQKCRYEKTVHANKPYAHLVRRPTDALPSYFMNFSVTNPRVFNVDSVTVPPDETSVLV